MVEFEIEAPSDISIFLYGYESRTLNAEGKNRSRAFEM